MKLNKLAIALTACALFVAPTLFAQEDDGWTREPADPASAGADDGYEMKTLFSGKKIKHGAYLSFDMAGTQLDDDEGLLVGGRLAWVINHKVAVGLAGYGLTSDVTPNEAEFNPDIYNFGMGYGGMFVEPILFPQSPIHVSFPILVGAGGAGFNNTLRYYDTATEEWVSFSRDTDGFFVVEPGVQAELNVFKFLRFATGVSYRRIQGLNLGSMDNDALDGFTVGTSLKIGIF